MDVNMYVYDVRECLYTSAIFTPVPYASVLEP